MELTPTNYDRKHIVELQSVRGLAALLVLFHHGTMYYRYDAGVRSWAETILNAHAAVVTFYVLSGYVLALALARKPFTFANTASFYTRRLFRIYPALIVASGIGLAYTILFHGRELPAMVSDWWPTNYRMAPLTPASIAAAFLAMGRALPLPIWSIFVELFGSLLLPLIALAAFRNRTAFAALTLLLAAFSMILGEQTRMDFGVYLVTFCFGASIALWQDWLARRFSAAWLARMIALLALISTIGIRQIGPWSFETAYHAAAPTILEGLSAMVLIASITARPAAFALLRWPAIVWYGDISYSLYLVHLPILAFVAGIGGEILGLPLLTGAPLNATLTLMVVTLAISSGVAAIMFKGVELPGINAGSHLLSRWLRKDRF